MKQIKLGWQTTFEELALFAVTLETAMQTPDIIPILPPMPLRSPSATR
jgi:hypothetical protein